MDDILPNIVSYLPVTTVRLINKSLYYNNMERYLKNRIHYRYINNEKYIRLKIGDYVEVSDDDYYNSDSIVKFLGIIRNITEDELFWVEDLSKLYYPAISAIPISRSNLIKIEMNPHIKID